MSSTVPFCTQVLQEATAGEAKSFTDLLRLDELELSVQELDQLRAEGTVLFPP